ncbi:uncharacterized protein EV420DRAFT_1488714 [Desarmillaria tabescens]|uniref:Uncharacterized protein n=1 Tax=Armillaria tabescens TaxID=1929756 RepID=A0AA39MHU6_ARMTA|nr:uncharacterized protein EV420DRAFT_1488714 [Desarmillaria tabescens]KAK0434269.1 hypothetical protein EV420DRAFT_1488714 [Desarmillaria tabescens]
MNAFQAGTRVSFFDANGQLVTGVVEATSRLSDGTQMVLIKRDNGGTVTLPARCEMLARSMDLRVVAFYQTRLFVSRRVIVVSDNNRHSCMSVRAAECSRHYPLLKIVFHDPIPPLREWVVKYTSTRQRIIHSSAIASPSAKTEYHIFGTIRRVNVRIALGDNRSVSSKWSAGESGKTGLGVPSQRNFGHSSRQR